jgi:hypothetical protein
VSEKIGNISSGGNGYQVYENSDGSKSVYLNEWTGTSHIGTAKPDGNVAHIVSGHSGSSKVKWK